VARGAAAVEGERVEGGVGGGLFMPHFCGIQDIFSKIIYTIIVKNTALVKPPLK
jgi:hypothetical protein